MIRYIADKLLTAAFIVLAVTLFTKAQSANIGFETASAIAGCGSMAATVTVCFTQDGHVGLEATGQTVFTVLGAPPSAPITSITYNGTAVPVTNGVAAITGPTKAVIASTSAPLQ